MRLFQANFIPAHNLNLLLNPEKLTMRFMKIKSLQNCLYVILFNLPNSEYIKRTVLKCFCEEVLNNYVYYVCFEFERMLMEIVLVVNTFSRLENAKTGKATE